MKTFLFVATRLGFFLAAVVFYPLIRCAAPAAEGEPPAVRVRNVRRAFHNGEHNAFTDLCRFRGEYYLALRSCPDGHMVHLTASIVVLASEDAKAWRQVHQFQVARRDTRDPHFLVFGEKLFVYTGTWYCGETSPKTYDLNQHLGYAVHSADGIAWSGPVVLEGTYGHYIWRAAAHDGKAYLCARRKREFVESDTPEDRDFIESAMLESDDGLVFRRRAFFQEAWGDETAFVFDAGGAITAVARTGGGRHAQLCRSAPPYDSWTRTDLGRPIGGPLIARWGERTLVGGRKTTPARRDEVADKGPTTTLSWLTGDSLVEFAELPSGGDCSYPGFVELSPTRGLVSWYSSHERDADGKPITAIYLADLEGDD
jgi:hypothetical protein